MSKHLEKILLVLVITLGFLGFQRLERSQGILLHDILILEARIKRQDQAVDTQSIRQKQINKTTYKLFKHLMKRDTQNSTEPASETIHLEEDRT